jgi:hypothetical protein
MTMHETDGYMLETKPHNFPRLTLFSIADDHLITKHMEYMPYEPGGGDRSSMRWNAFASTHKA